MDGERYYSFSPPEDLLTKIATRVEFFALDRPTSIATSCAGWTSVSASRTRAWKVCFFHHPLYTSGRYRSSSRPFRCASSRCSSGTAWTPCSRVTSTSISARSCSSGIRYFISGGAGSLRPGDGAPASYVARTSTPTTTSCWSRSRRRAALPGDLPQRRDDRCGHAVSRMPALRARREDGVSATRPDTAVRR